MALQVLTYKVHSCIGTDRRIDPHRIAAVIARPEADIIALQELDVGRRRTGGVDQAEMIATLQKMEAHFHRALHIEEERYDDAIVTALPTRLIRLLRCPRSARHAGRSGCRFSSTDRLSM